MQALETLRGSYSPAPGVFGSADVAYVSQLCASIFRPAAEQGVCPEEHTQGVAELAN